MRPSRQAWVTTEHPRACLQQELLWKLVAGLGKDKKMRRQLQTPLITLLMGLAMTAECSNPVRKPGSFHEEGNLCQLQVKRFSENVVLILPQAQKHRRNSNVLCCIE